MIIKSVRVQRFRCIRDATLPCENLTALVGANGAGKSAFLRALDIFYNANARLSDDDFYGRQTESAIIIRVVFAQLSAPEQERFKKYIEADELVVEKEIASDNGRISQHYFGMSLRNTSFAEFRAAGSAADRRTAYNALRSGHFQELPAYTNQDEAKQALEQWEEHNQDQCQRERDDGQFFGFKEVGEYNLERDTKFLLIPAVLDAADEATDKRGGALAGLLDLLVRNALQQRTDIVRFREQMVERYKVLMDPENLPELQAMEAALEETLHTFAPSAGLRLPWNTPDTLELPTPTTVPKLVEDDFESTVDRTGHGLQRAFLLTLLQHLALAQPPPDQGGAQPEEAPGPNLILGIEEPELYLHPSRQRHVARILLQLAEGSIPGVAQHTQVIYGTHSPLFVGIDRGDKVRVLRKVGVGDDQPQEAKVSATTMGDINRTLERASGDPAGSYTPNSTRARLKTIMTPWMNEGFFARVVVLVEGEEDRALLMGAAAVEDIDFDSLEISVIPAGGKRSLDRPAAIFKGLNIPVYLIWDSDLDGSNANPENNHRLLRLCGEEVEDWPNLVTPQFACFEKNFASTVRSEIGEQLWDELLIESRNHHQYPDNDTAKKNPAVVGRVIRKAAEGGSASQSLTTILINIQALAT